MTEVERRDPEPSALIERLLRRRTEPIGIIDVRQAQAHYARIAGWIAAHFPVLADLAARHRLSGNGGAEAAKFIYAGRAMPHPGEHLVCVPGTRVLALQAARGGGTPENFSFAPFCQRWGRSDSKRRVRGDRQSGGKKTLQAALEADPAASVEPPLSPAGERFRLSPLARKRFREDKDGTSPAGTPSSVLPISKEQGEKTTKYPQVFSPPAPMGEGKDAAVPAHTTRREGSEKDSIAVTQTSPGSPPAKLANTVWRVRRGATRPERLLPAEPLASTSTQPRALSRMVDGYDLEERLLPLSRGKVGVGVEPSLCTGVGCQ